ncbi:MAG: hypothetical protein KAJ46_05210 [Sedimentisphaerales bacterium]|nr:hypothetical protein [Sedimentisphaerales bacterium]
MKTGFNLLLWTPFVTEEHFELFEKLKATGYVPWAEIFQALKQGGYDGWLTIEAFGRGMPELAAATCVWRNLSNSPEEVYTEGFRLISKSI